MSGSGPDLRGILNAGHGRGVPYFRWNASTSKTVHCPTFAMAVLGGIGDLPDTIEDRAVVITMRRRASGEAIEPYRRRRAHPGLHSVRDRLHSWLHAHLDILRDAQPELPVEDRAADVWEPLVAVADLAGGDWPQRARDACRELTSATDDPVDNAGERLLADIREACGEGDDRLPTATLIDRLVAIEESPWGDCVGKRISPPVDRQPPQGLRDQIKEHQDRGSETV
jgi:hypothetical protein